MNKRKVFFYFFVSFIILFGAIPAFALAPLQAQLSNIYSQFIAKVQLKNFTVSQQIDVYTKIQQRIEVLLQSKILTQSKKDSLVYLYNLNQKQLSFLQSSSEKTSTKSDLIIQREKELKYLIALNGTTDINISLPSFIATVLQSSSITFQLTNDRYEYRESTKIKKYFFKNYYEITASNYKAFIDKTGVILRVVDTDSYIFVEDFHIEEKIPYSKLFSSEFSDRFLSDSKRYVLVDGVYYSYDFDNYNVFDDVYGMYESNLSTLGFSLDTAIFYLDEKGNFGFIKDPTKIKLIKASIVENITNIEEFLRNLIDDKKYLRSDTDEYFLQLQKEVGKLFSATDSNDKKIEKIYEWIIKNISYTSQVDLSDKKIFSGILTYKNKDGVCDGYTKLMGYMLLFAGISDVEVIKGYVIDVPDFPRIGHAWVKIGNTYYDPTFDDPIGISTPLTFEQYKYYGLPKDLFYTNRYNYEELPEYLVSASLSQRKKLVAKNLSELTNKYKDSGYTLLLPYLFREKFNLNFDDEISIDALKNILSFYQVSSDFTFVSGGKKKFITFLQYYTLNNTSEIEVILSQHRYDVSGLYLFLWETGPGTSEYRIGYDVAIK